MGTQLYTTTGTWNWPIGVTQVTAELLGGGGAGGSAAGNPSTGGGGKGGSYAKKSITKGAETSLTINIGAGGTAGVAAGGNGGNGGASTVVQNGSTVASAAGGTGGTGTSANSGGGAGATALNGSNIGDTVFVGGNGANGVASTNSAAGGGSAGPTSDGGNGSGNTGGSAGSGLFLDGTAYQSDGANGPTNNSVTTALTPTAGWTVLPSNQTAGGNSTTNIAFRGEYIISTGTGAASDPTYTASDCVSLYFTLKEVTTTPTGPTNAQKSGMFMGGF